MILQQNLHFLRQGQGLLANLDADVYAAQANRRSAIGAHLRHCVDYYHCFLCGLESGRVDYDARQRCPELESDPNVASEALAEIARRLEVLDPGDFFRVLEIKVDTPADAAQPWSRSTLLRELQFLVSHTVHHYALIALLLRQNDIDPGEEFGVAPSTLKYRGGPAAAGTTTVEITTAETAEAATAVSVGAR